jgi:hypothetical protein
MLDTVVTTEDASVGSVRADLAVADALYADLPLTAQALREGRLSADKARLLARSAPTSPARRVALRDPEHGEAFLLAKALGCDVHQLLRVVRAWGARVDPAADDQAHRDHTSLHQLTVSDAPEGCRVTGLVSHETGELLRTALRAATGVPAKTDPRTRAQRDAAALHTILRVFLDTGTVGEGAKVRPHLNVTVSYDTLHALADAVGIEAAVFTETGLPIPRVVLNRLRCDSELSRVVFGPDGVVLDAGRTQRIMSPEQRRAVITRDGECQHPHCHAPPRYCEVHHRIWWERGGVTSVKDSVLLCFFHHDWVHSRDITITRRISGWEFRDKHGNPIK